MSIPSVPTVGGLATCVDGRSTAPEKSARTAHVEQQSAPDSSPVIGKQKRDKWLLAELTIKLDVSKHAADIKRARPNDLYTLIADRTNAEGRIDCSGITKLTLSHSSFTDVDLALLMNFVDLNEVDLSDCTNITGKGIVTLPRKIEVINLTYCNAITDEDLAALPPGLKKVNLTDCINLTGAAVPKLPRNIREANFTGCIGLANVVKGAFPPHLEKVNFTDCVNLTDADVAKLPGTVKMANFSNCPNVSASMIQSLRQRGVRIVLQKSPLNFEPAPVAPHRR